MTFGMVHSCAYLFYRTSIHRCCRKYANYESNPSPGEQEGVVGNTSARGRKMAIFFVINFSFLEVISITLLW